MSHDISRRALLRGVGAVGIGVGALALFPSVALVAPLTEVLVFATTAGSRHDSVPAGIASIRQLGDQNGPTVDADTNLAQYQAVVWLSATGDMPDPAGAEHNWAWHGSLAGAYLATRSGQQQATLIVEDRMNDSTAHLPATGNRVGEYRPHPWGAVSVLVRLNESAHGSDDHPFTWWHDVGAGHAWYTGLGDTAASHSDTLFTRLALGGIHVAVRAIPTGCDNRAGRRSRVGPLSDGENAECLRGGAVADPELHRGALGGQPTGVVKAVGARARDARPESHEVR
jgi:hypothetical protein